MAHDENDTGQAKRAYTWPWWVLGALLLGILLAIVWMSHEIARARMIRDLNAPAPQTRSVRPG
jgi:hypothetical protein